MEPGPNLGEVTSALEWCLIPEFLIDQLNQLPWENVVGRGVLVRDNRCNTALVSVAEVTVLLLPGISELLECILWAVDDSIRAYATDQRINLYDLTWPYKDISPLSTNLIISPLCNHQWALGLCAGFNETVALVANAMQGRLLNMYKAGDQITQRTIPDNSCKVFDQL